MLSLLPRSSALRTTTLKSAFPVRQFSRKNNQTVDFVANFDKITEMAYPLRELQQVHKQWLRVSILRNGFDRSMGVPTVIIRTIVDGDDIYFEALSVEDGVIEHMKLSSHVAPVDGRRQFAALLQLAPGGEGYN